MVGKRGLGNLGVLSAIAGLGAASSARAQPIVGVPHDWQMGFPSAYTPLMERVESLNDGLLIIISFICAFVLALLLYAMWRFHASRNPVPTTTTHNTVIEIAWTVLPILILVGIAIPSFRLLYYGDKATDAAFTVKVTGHQWYWSYDYPDQGNFSVDSRILSEADRVKQKPQVPRLLAVDETCFEPAFVHVLYDHTRYFAVVFDWR
jgi:cytochrome c oxidase subunit 2